MTLTEGGGAKDLVLDPSTRLEEDDQVWRAVRYHASGLTLEEAEAALKNLSTTMGDDGGTYADQKTGVRVVLKDSASGVKVADKTSTVTNTLSARRRLRGADGYATARPTQPSSGTTNADAEVKPG